MEPEIQLLLAEHNKEAVDHLIAYVSSYVASQSHTLPPANCLPLSGFSYPPKGSTTPGTSQQQHNASCVSDVQPDPDAQTGCDAVAQFRKHYSFSSPFVALSGNKWQLCRCKQNLIGPMPQLPLVLLLCLLLQYPDLIFLPEAHHAACLPGTLPDLVAS